MTTPQQYPQHQPYQQPQYQQPAPVQQQQYQQPVYPQGQFQQPQYAPQPYPQQYAALQQPQQQIPPANYTPPSADDFLMGGSGAPSAKFLSLGDTTAGRITERPVVQQQRDIKTGEKKCWNDGNPMMQLVVTIQTPMRNPAIADDDGRRRLFVKGAMKNAVQDAVVKSGARGLEVGGHLSVTYTHDGESKSVGMNPPKQYRVEYTSAANAELMAPAAPAPQQHQQPAPVQQPQYQQPPQPQFQAAPQQPMPPQAQQYAAPMPPQVHQQPAPAGVSPEQLAAAQHDPAARALLQQIQQQGVPAAGQPAEPPF